MPAIRMCRNIGALDGLNTSQLFKHKTCEGICPHQRLNRTDKFVNNMLDKYFYTVVVAILGFCP